MKTKSKKKIVVSVLALAMGAGLAGSISGSVAWYQYSTRTSASFVGTSAGTSRNLEISLDGTNFSQRVEVPAATFKPTSVYITHAVANDPTSKKILNFVDHPIYKTAVLPAAPAVNNGYKSEFSFYFRCTDTTNSGPSFAAKDIYITHFAIVDKDGDSETPATRDITPAVRVFIEGGDHQFLLGTEAGSTDTFGELDLNKNGENDDNGWDVNDKVGTNKIIYTNKEGETPSYEFLSPGAVMVTATDPYHFTNNTGKILATTTDDTATGISAAVKVTVWIEGWQELATERALNPNPELDPYNNEKSQIWDNGWMKQDFELQFQFACEADPQ